MSYLVDALRKAERERLQGAAPGKATLAVDVPYDAERGGFRTVGWAIVVLVVCNLLLFGYLLWPRDGAQPDVAAPAVTAVDGTPPGAVSRQRTAQAASPANPGRSRAGPPAAPVTMRPASPVSAPVPGRDGRAVSGGGVPPERSAAVPARSIPARDAVPRVNIHGHMFSANPADSFILVDGRVYHEGERLPDGVTVVGIDRDGALLNYRGRRFHVNGPG